MHHKYTGVILKQFPLSEADELLTIYTREAGKLRVLARGARRIQSRLAGSLQSLNEVEFETHFRRPDSGRGMPILISARIKTMNEYLRLNLKKFAFALVGIETLYRLTPDSQENADAYDLLLNFLRNLGESMDEDLEVRRFQLRLLQVFGFAAPNANEVSQGDLDHMLQNVMERELKSKKLLNYL